MCSPLALSPLSQEYPRILLFARPEDIRTTSDGLSGRSLVQTAKPPRDFSDIGSHSTIPPVLSVPPAGSPPVFSDDIFSPCTSISLYFCSIVLRSQSQLLRTTVGFPHWCNLSINSGTLRCSKTAQSPLPGGCRLDTSTVRRGWDILPGGKHQRSDRAPLPRNHTIDHLHKDKPSVYHCSLVPRGWDH